MVLLQQGVHGNNTSPVGWITVDRYCIIAVQSVFSMSSMVKHVSLPIAESRDFEYLYLHCESTATKLELRGSCTNSTLGRP